MYSHNLMAPWRITLQKTATVGRLLFFGGWAFCLVAHTNFLPYKSVLSAPTRQLCSASAHAIVLLILAIIRKPDNFFFKTPDKLKTVMKKVRVNQRQCKASDTVPKTVCKHS